MGKYRKALAALVLSALLGLCAAAGDGNVSVKELVGVATETLTVAGVVFGIRNEV